jgi:hypothetical protein
MSISAPANKPGRQGENMKKIKILSIFAVTTLAAIWTLYDLSPESRAQETPVNRIYGRFYQLDVVAETGRNDLTNILDGVSINDAGTVAFAAQNSAGEGVFVSTVTSDSPVYISTGLPVSASRLFGKPVQINNHGLIVTRDRNSAAQLPTRLRVWDSVNPGSPILVATGGAAEPYNLLNTFPSLNNNVTGSANLANNVVFGANKQTGEAITVTPNLIPVTTDAASRNEIISGSQRPMIADTGKIVMKSSPPQGIWLYDNNFSTPEPIAAGDFVGALPATPDFGASPGISDDGTAVAFYAFLSNVETAAALNTNVGPGVFISVNEGTATHKIVRVAGNKVENAFDNPNADFDGICDLPAEQCINAELGVDSTGQLINFGETTINGANRFDKTNRVAVTHTASGASGLEDDSFVVSFIATPNLAHEKGIFSDRQGLWTVRVDVKKLDDGNLRYEVSRPVPVIQVGDMIGPRKIEGIGVYDQLAEAATDRSGAARVPQPGDHRVAFWATTTTGTTPGQIVVRATQLDTDRDALYDHWETAGGGIDFNGDGTLDFTPYAAPYNARADKRDIFVEIDSMEGFAPGEAALQQVRDAFEFAPSNGPGHPGFIDLHLMPDESIGAFDRLGFPTVAKFCPNDPQTLDFDDLRGFNFGTEPERENENLTKAKALVVRYAVFGRDVASNIDSTSGSCIAQSKIGDSSSILGDGLIVGLGVMNNEEKAAFAGGRCVFPETRAECGLREAQAATLMHELGHTLGLRHGGGDDDNNKPNYLSIMSYSYSVRSLDPNRPLSFSGEVLDPLNESHGLSEPAGVSGPNNPQARMIIWAKFGFRKKKIPDGSPAVDWNQTNGATETNVDQDINYVLTPSGSDPAEDGRKSILKGFNDWKNLKFNFRNSLSFNQTKKYAPPAPNLAGPVFVPPKPELTRPQIVFEAANFDADDDGIVNLDDNCPGTANPDQADNNGDGIGNACSLAPTAASVGISGQVFYFSGQPVSRAVVSLTDQQGETRRATTNSFGFYRFDDVPAGRVYIVSAGHRKYRFNPESRILTVSEDLSGIDFTAR